MRYLFILFILAGCTIPHYVITPDGEKINCAAVSSLWWGEKGDDPSETDLWKCWDWELRRRN